MIILLNWRPFTKIFRLVFNWSKLKRSDSFEFWTDSHRNHGNWAVTRKWTLFRPSIFGVTQSSASFSIVHFTLVPCPFGPPSILTPVHIDRRLSPSAWIVHFDLVFDWPIKNDKKYLMAILNRPDNTKELISQETISKNKNGELFKFYFNLLSPEALETLNRIHLDDLDIFNYSFDPIKKLIGGWD